MKKVIVIILIVLSVSVLMILGCGPKVKEGALHKTKTNATPDERAKWNTFGETIYGSWFYDGTSITQPSKDVVRVWVKLVWSDKGRAEYVEKYGEKFKTLDYTLGLIEIHCAGRIRSLSESIYSTNRDLLSSFEFENALWRFMSPDSVMDDLRKAICK